MSMNLSVPLRITRWCYPVFVGNRPAPNGGVYWLSRGAFFARDIQHKLPPLEFVTNFSASTKTHVALQTMFDGNADMDLDEFQVSWSRYQFVDFLHPRMNDNMGLYIFSAVDNSVQAEIIEGVFDIWSYLGIAAAMVTLICLLYLANRYKILNLGSF